MTRRRLGDVPLEEAPVGADERGGRRWSGRPRSAATSTASAGRGRGGRTPAPGRRPGAWPRSSPLLVDAHVTADHERGVVLVGQHPADLLRAGTTGTVTAIVPPGRSTRASSARAAASSGMCSSTSAAMTRSNGPSANGRRVASPCTVPAQRRSSTSPAVGHRPEGVAHLLQLGAGVVEGDDARAAPGRLEGVAAEAAAEVEQPVARAAGRGGRSGPSASTSRTGRWPPVAPAPRGTARR